MIFTWQEKSQFYILIRKWWNIFLKEIIAQKDKNIFVDVKKNKKQYLTILNDEEANHYYYNTITIILLNTYLNTI